MTASKLVAAALFAAVTACAVPAGAADAVKVTEPPAPVRRHLEDARLAATGRLTWFGLLVYDAALFAPRRFDPADAAAEAFGLVLTYARRLDGKGIANASRDEIQRLGFGDAAKRARWHEQMLALFPDVDEGRRLTGIHVPRQGARFYFDDQFIGAIEDPEFARAFFSIWLDERTRAPQLRANLLKSTPAARPTGS